MGIKQFETTVSGRYVAMQQPLLTSPDASVCWVTRCNLIAHERPVKDEWLRIGTVTRTTTRCNAKTGKRVLRYAPLTEDVIQMWTSGWQVVSVTKWDRQAARYSQETTSGAGLSFVPNDLNDVLAGCVKTGEASLLADWFGEFSTEVGPLFNSPGWLPASEAEFEKVRRKRSREHNAALRRMNERMNEDVLLFGSDDEDNDNEDEDRWR